MSFFRLPPIHVLLSAAFLACALELVIWYLGADLGPIFSAIVFATLLAALWHSRSAKAFSFDAQAPPPIATRSVPARTDLDPLTGLGGKAEFERLLGELMERRPGFEQRVALMTFDVDRLKDINSYFGYSIGDQILRQIGFRLAAITAETGMAARLASDRFALICCGINSTEAAADVARSVLASIAKEVRVDGYSLTPTASVGVALAPDHGTTLAQLMRCSEMAGDDAKRGGGNRFQIFDPRMDSALRSRKLMERELRHALDNGEFELHYQPQIDLANGKVIAFEALIRWNHPEKGRIPPLSFIPTAEASGLIRPIGTWVLEEACEAARRWRTDGFEIAVAVNVSAAQLRQGDLVGSVSRMLEAAKLPPHMLELEVTESLFVDPSQIVIRRNLAAFAELGVSLAIDDFGTGYSSLSYLKRLPVSKIKIDKSFLVEAGRGGHDDAIVRTIISLARSFGKRVLAEGVETAQQQDFLVNEGCDEAQGYKFGRPLPEADALADLRARAGRQEAFALRAAS